MSASCFNLDQSKILSSPNGLNTIQSINHYLVDCAEALQFNHKVANKVKELFHSQISSRHLLF